MLFCCEQEWNQREVIGVIEVINRHSIARRIPGA